MFLESKNYILNIKDKSPQMRKCVSSPHILAGEKFNSGNNIAGVCSPSNKQLNALFYSRFGQDIFVEYIMFEYICFDLGNFYHGLKRKPSNFTWVFVKIKINVKNA